MLNKESIKNGLIKAGNRVGESFEAVINDRIDRRIEEREISEHFDEIIERERNSQFDIDVHCALMAFIELKADDDKIYYLLNKAFGIATRNNAEKRILTARIDYRCEEIEAYLKKQTQSSMEAIRFTRDYDVKDRLMQNPELLKQSVPKLIAILKKK